VNAQNDLELVAVFFTVVEEQNILTFWGKAQGFPLARFSEQAPLKWNDNRSSS